MHFAAESERLHFFAEQIGFETHSPHFLFDPLISRGIERTALEKNAIGRDSVCERLHFLAHRCERERLLVAHGKKRRRRDELLGLSNSFEDRLLLSHQRVQLGLDITSAR